MKAIVHIGTEKTGTSSIQKYLHKNRRRLRAAGFHVLQTGGKENNRGLAAYCRRDDQPDDFFRDNNIDTVQQRAAFRKEVDAQLQAEMDALPRHIHTVLMSSEHFSSRLLSPQEMECFQRLLQRFFDQVQVLCYIREQVQACESWYSTTLKVGGSNSLQEFMQRCKPSTYYFNYDDMLANWESCFGKEAISVNVFARQHFVNGDLLDDFTVRLDPALQGTLSKKLVVENESLTPAGQALARAINVAFPIISSEPDVLKLRDRSKELIYGRLRGSGQVLAQQTRLQYHEAFADSNERVRERYFPQLDRLFEPPGQQSVAVSLDDAFERTVKSIIKLLNKHPRIDGGDYVDLFGAIATSVADAISGERSKAARITGTNIVLDDNDAQLLNVVARRMEARNVHLAQRLMQIAASVNPQLPGVQERLRVYEQEQEVDEQPLFLLSYSGGDEPEDPEELKAYQFRVAQWLATLAPAVGPPLTGIEEEGVRVTADAVSPLKQQLHSYSIIRAQSLDEAVAAARQCPIVDRGGEVQVLALQPFPMEFR